MSATAKPRAALPTSLVDIQAPVRDQLAKVPDELRRIVVADCQLIADVNEHLMGMKGKLFRPTLALLASAVEGRPHPRAITLAATIELIHLATLVHDDAVDHSSLRRGMPTINSMFSHQISVIMGDFLYSRALAELVRLGDLDALRALTTASNDMTLGEMRQLGAVDALSFSEDDYNMLIRAKTASLISAACEVGAGCGASQHRTALARYGERLGMAFQIADDLLDYTSAQEVTGKPAGLDLREHKVTLPLIASLRAMRPAQRARAEELFATEMPDDEMIADVVEIVTELGGLEYAKHKGEQFALEAEAALRPLPATPAKDALTDAIAYVMDRRS